MGTKRTAEPTLTVERWFLSVCYRKAVFVSYSHDSDEHAGRILDLANALRCETCNTGGRRQGSLATPPASV